MAEIRVEGDQLVLHLTPTQKVVGFHADIRAPLSAVQSVTAVEKPWLALRGRRMAGTALRGSTAIGTWIHGDRRFDFCVVRGQQPAVQVDLNTGRFARWLVCRPEGSDIHAEARQLAAAAGIAAQ
jgi:hypothetical protein